jgi:hypothetical protein
MILERAATLSNLHGGDHSTLSFLRGEKMTTRDIAEAAGCSRRVTAETIKAVYPEKVRKGAATDLSEKEAFAIMGRLPKRLIPSQAATRPAQIEAPKMEPRAELRQLVARAVKKHGTDYSEEWGFLYGQAFYRLGVNLSLRARNEGVGPLDIAEKLDILPQLVAIAREVFA